MSHDHGHNHGAGLARAGERHRTRLLIAFVLIAAYFVVELDGRVVGGAGIGPLAEGPAGTCELRKMYFLGEARGQGQGQRDDERHEVHQAHGASPSRQLRVDLLTHQRAEQELGFLSLVHRDPHKRAGLGVHGGFPELLGVHLAEALEALQLDAVVSS